MNKSHKKTGQDAAASCPVFYRFIESPGEKIAFIRQGVFVQIVVILLRKGRLAGGLDLVQIDVGVKGVLLHLNHTYRNVGAVVGNPLVVVQNIGEDKAQLDGAVFVLQAADMARLYCSSGSTRVASGMSPDSNAETVISRISHSASVITFNSSAA